MLPGTMFASKTPIKTRMARSPPYVFTTPCPIVTMAVSTSVLCGSIKVLLTKQQDLTRKPNLWWKPFQSSSQDHIEWHFEDNECWKEDLQLLSMLYNVVKRTHCQSNIILISSHFQSLLKSLYFGIGDVYSINEGQKPQKKKNWQYSAV